MVTLPKVLREDYGLAKGDAVVFKKTAEGWLVKKKEPDPRQVLAELEDILESRGITVEEWLASGREIRGEIYETKYARDADG